MGTYGLSSNLLGKVREARTRGFVTDIEEPADVVTLGIRVRRRKTSRGSIRIRVDAGSNRIKPARAYSKSVNTKTRVTITG